MSSDVVSELKSVLEPYSIPAHVVNRMSVLMAGMEATYVDGKVTKSEGRSTSGEAVIFTSGAAILATWRDHYLFDDASRTTATADVTVWSRAQLRSISIDSSQDCSNIDKDWDQASDGSWPYSGRLTLCYGQPEKKIELPMAPHRKPVQIEKFCEFVPSLLGDLK
jgi:hypothetical protein